MTISETIAADLAELVKKQNEFLASVTPFRDSFHKLISGIPAFQWLEDTSYITMDADAFALVTDTSKDGLVFAYDTIEDYDHIESVKFTVPFAYIDNPQKWADEFLARMERDTKAIQDAYDAVAPGVREKHNLNLNITHVISTGKIFRVTVQKRNSSGYMRRFEEEEAVMNQFTFFVEENEIVDAELYWRRPEESKTA
jgi:hypothetical protein